MNTLVDGEPGALLGPDDRGFLFGETVFETVAFRDRTAPLWDLHMARLARSAAWLQVDAPAPALWLKDCSRILPERGCFVVRLTLTAGSGGRGYWPAAESRPRRIVSRRDWPPGVEEQRRSGLHVRRCSFTLVNDAVGRGYKHGNRLLQVNAARECTRSGHDEAVLLDARDCMVEAISSNLLMVRQGRVLVHPAPAVIGVGLTWLRSRSQVCVAEEAVPYASLTACSEVLVINSVAGIRPVVAIDSHRFAIGPMCRHLQSLWDSQLI